VIFGEVHAGAGAILAQGLVVRAHGGAVSIGNHSAVLENGVVIGDDSLIGAGACVKQRDRFAERSILDGFPANVVDALTGPPPLPGWALPPEAAADLRRVER